MQLGKTLRIETLAEGIEDTNQLHHLQREACDSGQGYLFARPLTPDAIIQLITTKHRSQNGSRAPGAHQIAADVFSAVDQTA